MEPDSWLVTHDNNLSRVLALGDPILLHMPYSPGAPTTGTPVRLPSAGSDDIAYRYDFTLEPGESVALAWLDIRHLRVEVKALG